MCSNLEDNDTALMASEVKVNLDDNTKCRCCHSETALVVLRLKDPYCNNCFIPYVHHKFRSCLGKSKLMKPSDKVLVAFSGGKSSFTLLHMLCEGKNKNDAKKLLYDIIFCYIEEGAILNKNVDERWELVQKYKQIVESYNFPFLWTTLNRSVVNSTLILNINSELIEAEDINLLKIFNDLKSTTAKEDLLIKLKTELLVKIALNLKCNKLFSSEGQTSLAVKLLTSIAQGCEQLSYEVGFEDSRFDGVQILRPMRDIDNLEIEHYNKIYELESPDNKSSRTDQVNGLSIRKLTQEFVNGLQEEFPSTVSTVFRTGEKLNTIATKSTEDEKGCVLCHGSFKTNDGSDYLAESATAFSKQVSRPSTKPTKNINGCCGDCSCSPKPSLSELDLKNSFCYSCLLIIREMKSLENLPDNILNEVKKRSNLLALKDQISDFLL